MTMSLFVWGNHLRFFWIINSSALYGMCLSTLSSRFAYTKASENLWICLITNVYRQFEVWTQTWTQTVNVCDMHCLERFMYRLSVAYLSTVEMKCQSYSQIAVDMGNNTWSQYAEDKGFIISDCLGTLRLQENGWRFFFFFKHYQYNLLNEEGGKLQWML